MLLGASYGRKGLTTKGPKGPFGDDENTLIFPMVVIEYILRYTHIILHLHSIITLYYVNPSNYTLKKVNFTICKTYLNKLGFHFLKHGKLSTPRSLGIILTALNHTRKAGWRYCSLGDPFFIQNACAN